MSQTDSKASKDSEKKIYATVDRDQSKIQKLDTAHDQSASQVEEANPPANRGNAIRNEEALINKKSRKHNSSNRSFVGDSRKSLNSNGLRSIIASNAEENLLNNHKTKQILQNDRILLSNRITMLRKEEERLMKKIKGTREKAEKILAVRQRNEEKFHERLQQHELEKKRQEEQQEKIKLEKEKRREKYGVLQQQILDEK